MFRHIVLPASSSKLRHKLTFRDEKLADGGKRIFHGEPVFSSFRPGSEHGDRMSGETAIILIK
jgi:hypothetical protein